MSNTANSPCLYSRNFGLAADSLLCGGFVACAACCTFPISTNVSRGGTEHLPRAHGPSREQSPWCCSHWGLIHIPVHTDDIVLVFPRHTMDPKAHVGASAQPGRRVCVVNGTFA